MQEEGRAKEGKLPDQHEASQEGRCDVIGMVAADSSLRGQPRDDQLFFGQLAAKEGVDSPCPSGCTGSTAAHPAAQWQTLQGL